MESFVYEREAQLEADHWWFVGRRHLFRQELEKLNLPKTAKILDIGTGTGANLRFLRDMGFTNVKGLDSNSLARRFCAEKGLGEVIDADICALPFPIDTFDLVIATDVIEHVDAHERAVAEIQRVLKPGGVALLTVPAFSSLWGFQDEVAHHKRRYRQRPFIELVKSSNLKITTSYYFNFILFAPIWLARQILKFAKPRIQSENDINNPLINQILTFIFRADTQIARTIKPPFGVSILVLAIK